MINTLPALLQQRAEHHATAYTFLKDGETETGSLTYSALAQRAQAIAARLQTAGKAGDRVLLLYPPGLDYISAFFACAYAGMIAVPTYPPRRNRPDARLRGIVTDSGAVLALTDSDIFRALSTRLENEPALATVTWINSDEADPAAVWQPVAIQADTPAFLQYTSGSTGTPKGVIVTHANVLHDLDQSYRHLGLHGERLGVSWLPPYHDMGLMGAILTPLYAGFPVVYMTPMAFLQKPFRWLKAISDYRATDSAAPNFAYELCVQKITPEQRAQLDLSHWQLSITGAEPVRADTLARFSEAFAPCGFRDSVFRPAYGLAEATLLVSAATGGQSYTVLAVDSEALRHNRVQVCATPSAEAGTRLVACGTMPDDIEVQIVAPESGERCAPDQVGEIRVAGPNVAQGYWRKPESGAETFATRLADGSGPFLRTGDLGFLHQGQLYITGRIKDLIIIRGRNYYPQDIETVVEQCHPAITGVGAFAVDNADEEQLVVVAEMDRRHARRTAPKADSEPFDRDDIFAAVRSAVTETFELQVHTVVLLKPATLPRTSSGKIQRHACRDGFVQGTLEEIERDFIATDRGGETAIPELRPETLFFAPAPLRLALLETQLCALLGAALHCHPDQVDTACAVTELGVDSLSVVEIQYHLEVGLGLEMPMEEILSGATVTQLAAELAGQLEQHGRELPKLLPQAAQGEFPLSYNQRGLWFLYQLAPTSAAYNVVFAVTVRGPLRVQALQRSLHALAQRHPMLRTTYHLRADAAVQTIQTDPALHLEISDARSWTPLQLEQQLSELAQRPFDLEHGPILRAGLYQRDDAEQVLFWSMHHIATDLWSMQILMDEWLRLYAQDTQGIDAALPELAVSYTDFSVWQQQMLAGPEGERLWRYWQQQLAGELPVLDLPSDYPRPAMQSFRGLAQDFSVDPTLTAQLKDLARSTATTLNTLLLAVFQVLLARYSRQDEVLTGVPTAGRSQAQLGNIVGYLVNPVVIRGRLQDNPGFGDFLHQLRDTLLDALKHQAFPFQLLIERLQPERDPSRASLFQAAFVLQQTQRMGDIAPFVLKQAGGHLHRGNLEVESLPLPQQIAQFDITLVMTEHGGTLAGSLEYCSDLFSPATAERMTRHFVNLLQGVVQNPETPVNELPLLDAAERRLLAGFGGTAVAQAPGDLIPAQVAATAARTPQAVAVREGDKTLTYADLETGANRYAQQLQQSGVTPGSRVGVCLPRCLELPVMLLAVLKSGAAYVALDPNHPPERLNFMLEDAGAVALICTEDLAAQVGWAPHQFAVPTVHGIIGIAPRGHIPVETPAAPNLTPDTPAYIIYTSGSTGQPKGVEIPHRGLANLCAWHNAVFGITTNDRATLVANPAFDASVWELWPYLCAGASVQVVEPARLGDPEALRDWLVAQGISISFLPTPLAEQLLNLGWPPQTALRFLLTGGDRLRRQAPANLPFKLINNYGPTENSVVTTSGEVAREAGDSLPTIGRPIQHVSVYVLDHQRRPVPVGVPGELYIAGPGLALGYLNRPDLTAQAFVTLDLAADGLPPADGEAVQNQLRAYRSGDLVSWRPEGELMFHERIDRQVKIRGFRIELGEIENLLRAHPAVTDAAVLDHSDRRGERRLVAYVVPAEPQTEALTEQLRSRLKAKLPDYMVPTAFMTVERIPLTANGKVDRRALPQPEITAQAYVAPCTSTEEYLAQLWAEVLNLEKVGIHDNFFELGGHSLLATQLISQARARFGVELAVETLFKNPTIAEIGEHLDTLQWAVAGETAQDDEEREEGVL